MKIMMVTPYFYPKVGGLENYALNIAKELSSYGHDVFVVTSNHSQRKYDTDVIDGMRIIRLPIAVKLSNTPYNPLWRWYLRKITKDEKPDLINAHLPVPYIADMAVRAAHGVPVALTYHNDLVKESGLGRYLAKLFYVLYMDKTLKLANLVIATSQYYADTSPYLAKVQDKVRIVPPGVDVSRFNTAVDNKWLSKKYPHRKIVLFVGNMDKTHSHKGMDVLLEALIAIKKKIPNVLLLAAGKGDGVEGYSQIAKQHGLNDNVDFIGFVSDDELPRYYAGADLFVLPTKTAAEGFGMVIMEAAACGTSSVGSRIGGIPFAIQDGVTGKLVDASSSESLANGLAALLDSPKTLKQYGSAGAIRARNEYSWDVQARLTEKAANECVSPTIIQVTPYYPPYLGGMQQVVEDISTGIAKTGHKVVVVTSNIGANNENSPSLTRSENLVISRLAAVEFAHLPIIWNLFVKLLRTPKKSIFHVHISQAFIPEIALLAAKIKRAPCIAHFHLDVAPSGKFGFVFAAYKRTLLPWMLRNSDYVVVFSSEQTDLVVRKYGVQPNKVKIIPNGVADEYFTKHNRKLHQLPRLLYVGRVTHQKNVSQLLHALDGVSGKFETRIVGDGELLDEMKVLVRELKLKNVTFTGRLSGELVKEEYDWADIFVLPSEREGMPLVVLEAMASGLPIIANDVVGVSNIIYHGKNGLLCELNDILAMKENLTSLNEKTYRQLSDNAAKTSKQYSLSRVINEFERLYCDCLAGRQE